MAHSFVSVTLLNYNGLRFVEAAMASIFRQTHRPLELLVLDQNSHDGSHHIVRNTMLFAPRDLPVAFSRSPRNIGFSAGHNELMRRAQGEFILCLNQDAFLDVHFIERALSAFDDVQVAAVQGKVLRYDFAGKQVKQSLAGLPVIDTTGLFPLRSRRVINRGQGDEDAGQYERAEEVFGADGAVPVYRKSALDDVAVPILNPKFQVPNSKQILNSKSQIPNNDKRFALSDKPEVEYFDEDFFCYKEDVDLAWRLRLAGWKTIYRPDAIAYHGRGSGDSMARDPIAIVRERLKINPRAKFYSFRNQRLMQAKNEMPSLLFRDALHWLPKEVAAWGYSLLCEGAALPRALWQWRELMPRAFAKRKEIMAKRRINSSEIAKWFV